jgi:DNA-binding CsgD family transcriptional regulator
MDPKPNGHDHTHTEVSGDTHAEAVGDCSSDVSRAPTDLGAVKAVRFLDPARDPSAFVGRPLAALLEALGIDAPEAERTSRATLEASRHVAIFLPPEERAFRLVMAEAIDEGTLRVTVRCIDSTFLSDLVEVKMARIAEARGLSERERQVLRLLLRGRGVEDIATMLEIAPRTVKFHQANVLQKLGADSRLDLLRVVL